MDEINALELHDVCKSFKTTINQNNKKKIVVNNIIENLSLKIKKGEVVGIIGANGSGKSTLLSIIAKIINPDSGDIQYSGKLAAILELGMGFHPDMSGRENIYLKGEMYGFSKKEIEQKMPQIIEYSGLKDYIEHPVRTYSSGMIGRLAFAIMIHVDADILLIDEILSVGDVFFELKAKEHFKNITTSGKTILVVSHQLKTIETMCTRAIWLDCGAIRKDGSPKEVCQEYENYVYNSPEVLLDLAQSGLAESQYKLSLMYKDGKQVTKNMDLYEAWLKKAVYQGHIKAQVEYADLLLERGERTNAMELYHSAANLGDYTARVKVATLSTNTESSLNELKSIYKEIATPGNALNEYRYAELLMKTALTYADVACAFEMYRKSAEDGLPTALYQMGQMYKDGLGVQRDYQQMEKYY